MWNGVVFTFQKYLYLCSGAKLQVCLNSWEKIYVSTEEHCFFSTGNRSNECRTLFKYEKVKKIEKIQNLLSHVQQFLNLFQFSFCTFTKQHFAFMKLFLWFEFWIQRKSRFWSITAFQIKVNKLKKDWKRNRMPQSTKC